jgi:hypothetical protein
MSMIKRANGEIETFTDEQGKEVVAQSQDVVWADEKDEKFKDEIRIPVVADFALDIDVSDDDDETIAKDC